tara:strand:- start:490 stop:885 length:396 start_codon:yes stop_codon:yes gene_type:complete
MDNINVDFNNPFLYLAGISTVSILTNIYCCYRRSQHNKKKEQEVNLELTSEFKNIINEVNEKIELPAMKDQETVIDVKIVDENTSTEATTQTEDSQLYEMMGERFNQELDFYKKMNINKKKADSRLQLSNN